MEAVQKFADTYKDKKILFKDIRFKKEQLQKLYVDLYCMGVNEIVFCDEKSQHKLELSQLLRIPDFSNLPENQRPLINPSLQLSTIYFLQEIRRPSVDTKAPTLEALAEEMYANLAKARFLMPALLTANHEGKSKFGLPYIKDKNGNKFQPIFSDHTEYAKHTSRNKPAENTRVLNVGIAELQKYLMPEVLGYMLNPDGYCHVLKGQQLKFIMERFRN